MNPRIKSGFREICHGFKELTLGIAQVTWAFLKRVGRWLDTQIHEWPYVFLTLIVLVMTVVFYYSLANARIERDTYQQKAYNASVKLHQLEIIYDSLTKK